MDNRVCFSAMCGDDYRRPICGRRAIPSTTVPKSVNCKDCITKLLRMDPETLWTELYDSLPEKDLRTEEDREFANKYISCHIWNFYLAHKRLVMVE